MRHYRLAWAAFVLTGFFTQGAVAQCAQAPKSLGSGDSMCDGPSFSSPTYPPLTKAAKIQGIVVLKGKINKSGAVQDVALVSGHPLLVQAAIEAVKKWNYKPYMVNGSPIDTETTIRVVFKLVGQEGNILGNKMAEIHVHTALLVPSQAVDEFPVWSPDSRFLATNIQGKWFKLDALTVELQEATWHGQRIGAIRGKPELESMTNEEAAEWAKQGQHGNIAVAGNSGVKAEMQHHELSSSLVVSQGSSSSVIWKSDLENCGALSLSPNGAYLAYICETNGVLVMDIGRAVQTSPNPR